MMRALAVAIAVAVAGCASHPPAASVTTSTPPPTPEHLLTPAWTAKVGLTDVRTTMAVVGGTVLIGTHGQSYDSTDDPDGGVHVIDGKTGATIRIIATPGEGKRDVCGIAVDGEKVFFSTANDQIVAARLDGSILWRHALGARARAAPTLVDLNGDGTRDVVVGDDLGRVHVIDGPSGAEIWSRTLEKGPSARSAIEAGIAAADLTGDRVSEVVAASWSGEVLVLDAKSGRTIWSFHDEGRVRASPVLVDLDGDGRLEVVAAWDRGSLHVLDGGTGRDLWTGVDDRAAGLRTAVVGSIVPFVGAQGRWLALPAGRESEGDGLLLFAEHAAPLRSGDEEVLGGAVVASLAPGAAPSAVFGSGKGEVVALDAHDVRSVVARVAGAIEAPMMVADVDGDGAYELLVASRDDALTCLRTGVRERPVVSRFRGDAPTNDGVLRAANLGWKLRY